MLFKENTEYEILTPTGWSDFKGINKITKNCYITIMFSDGSILECSENHRIKVQSGKFEYAKNIKIGDAIISKNGIIFVSKLITVDEPTELYDIVLVDANFEFYSNDVISHNCAFIENAETIWSAAWATLSTGGKAIILSTPNGVGNLFHKLWIDAKAQKNNFNAIQLHWSMHPERTQAWRDDQDKTMGPRMAAQECFSGNTRIYSDRGLICIKDIKMGDKVLTHTGNFEDVLSVIQKQSSDTCDIYSYLNRTIVSCTKNHPFYDLNNSWIQLDNIKNEQLLRSFPNKVEYSSNFHIQDLCEIIKLKYFSIEIDKDNYDLIYVNDRKFKTRHNRYIEFDYDLGYLIGLYLAEGSKDRRRTCFSFNYLTELSDWPKKIASIIEDKFGLTSYTIRKTGENSANIEFSSVILSNFISFLVDGDKCYNKKISEFLYKRSNKELLKGILDGAVVGDGCLTNTANKTIAVTSEDLIYDIRYIANILGYTYNSIKHAKHLNHTRVWPNGKIYNTRKVFSLSFLKTKHTDVVDRKITSVLENNNYGDYSESYKNTFNKDGGYTNCKIFKCANEKQLPIDVYNLEIANDNSYVTEHFIVHNCDASFITSGATVVPPEILQWYKETMVQQPKERRDVFGMKDLWIWKHAEPSKQYIICSDVARGDSKDKSAFHVFDLVELEQVAEYEGMIPTKEYGNLLVTTATEYNDALLIVENATVGWATIQQVIDRQYKNLYYTTDDLRYLDPENQYTNRYYSKDKKKVAGFTTSSKVRPLMVSKMDTYFRERILMIRSERTIDQLFTFNYYPDKAKAAPGYNDDLVLALCIGLWVRDVALRLQSENLQMQKLMLDNFGVATHASEYVADAIHTTALHPGRQVAEDSWKLELPGGETEDLKEWL